MYYIYGLSGPSLLINNMVHASVGTEQWASLGIDSRTIMAKSSQDTAAWKLLHPEKTLP